MTTQSVDEFGSCRAIEERFVNDRMGWRNDETTPLLDQHIGDEIPDREEGGEDKPDCKYAKILLAIHDQGAQCSRVQDSLDGSGSHVDSLSSPATSADS